MFSSLFLSLSFKKHPFIIHFAHRYNMGEKCISITKVQIGHIVGKGGATIKEIQEKSGAKLEIIDGPQVKITADDDAKVAAAEAEVRQIISNQENPDYEGPEGARLRKEANDAGDKRFALYDEATAKRSAGDHDGANELAAAAKASGALMEQKHREAARAIARYNNEDKGKGDDYFDMHGLREEEAIEMLQERVALLEAKPAGTVTEFEVIPGAGHHSAPGKQKLKGATEDYLKQRQFAYEAASAGSFLVRVPGTGAEAARQEGKDGGRSG
ncbi:Smr domain containing protein [Strigomonas culicis]|uniref:Smr domain containing protein n=1 Tax=Strigomonas culicis TaxID=28005 RepID=S9UGJ4_9TRYP|nr:Smr domain containing protein [Strigomonas culicis]|eukprot:EPY27874.1 Smr domain containing protein [Strigomonas culicis]